MKQQKSIDIQGQDVADACDKVIDALTTFADAKFNHPAEKQVFCFLVLRHVMESLEHCMDDFGTEIKAMKRL